jgi:hypothetical protein
LAISASIHSLERKARVVSHAVRSDGQNRDSKLTRTSVAQVLSRLSLVGVIVLFVFLFSLAVESRNAYQVQTLTYIFGATAIFLSLYLPGYVFLSLFEKSLSVAERSSLSFAVTVPTYSLVAVLGAPVYAPWYVFAVADLFLVALSVALMVKRRLYAELVHADLFGIEAAVIMFTFGCLLVALPAPARVPSFNIQVQNVLHVPAGDNYLPYRLAQFLVNHLDPQRTRFYGSWSIADRTPLMGLASAFFLQTLNVNVPSAFLWTLSATAQGNSYQFFQIIGSLLNSLILVGAYTLLKQLFDVKVARISTILLLMSSFVLLNTVFTWPKNLTAYFVLVSYYLLVKGRPVFSGFCAALAFLSHPLGALYVVGAMIYGTYKKVGRRFILSSALTVSPWSVWAVLAPGAGGVSRFVYYPFFSSGNVPPTNQPLPVFEQFLKTPIQIAFWNRVVTAYDVLLPFQLGQHITGAPSVVTEILSPATVYTLGGALGIPLFVFCYYGFIRNFGKYKRELTCFVIVPFILYLVETGSPFGLTALHVMQPLIPLMLGLGVSSLIGKRRLFTIVVSLYLLQNVSVLWLRSYLYDALVKAWSTDPLLPGLVFAYYCSLLVWSSFRLKLGSNIYRRVLKLTQETSAALRTLNRPILLQYLELRLLDELLLRVWTVRES